MAFLASADNTTTVQVKSTADTRGIDDTSKALGKLDKDAQNAGSGSELLGKAASVAKVAVLALGAASAAAGVSFIKQAADFQQTRIGLENMLGSADKARGLLAEISKFAADTPFEFPELAQATRQLVAFGFSADDAFNTMKQLGDVSAAVGAPINDLAYLMGTLRTQGRAFTVDIRQFAQRGIPIYEYLAKVLNTNEQALSGMIEEGKVGFPEVQKAFKLMTDEGGKFHGTMDKQSKSLSGLWSTLSDNIGQAGRELVGINQQGDIAEGSVFAILATLLTNVTKMLPDFVKAFQTSVGQVVDKVKDLAGQVGSYLGPKLDELWKSIKQNLMPALNDLWHNVIEPLLPVIGVSLVWALGAVVDVATRLVDAFGYVYGKLKEGDPVWWGLVGLLGTVSAALALSAGVTAFTTAMNTITTVTIPAVMTKFAALSALVTSPIIMPAIVIAAAIAALVEVQRQAELTRQAIDAADDADRASTASQIDAHQKIVNLSRNGTPEQKARANDLLKKGYATGGYTGPGGEKEVAGIVHKGEYVIPKKDVDQSTGKPKSMGNVFNITNNNYTQIDYDKGIQQIGFKLRTT